MTPSQHELSELREKLQLYEKLKSELNVTGDIELEASSYGPDTRIEGTLNGHSVYLTSRGYGFIDGLLLGDGNTSDVESFSYEGSDVIRKLYNKFYKLAELRTQVTPEVSKEAVLIDKAQDEVLSEAYEYERKKAGKSQYDIALEVAEELLGE